MSDSSTVPLSSTEKFILVDQLQEERSALLGNLLMMLGIALIIPLVMLLRNRHAPTNKMGYLHPVLWFAILLLGTAISVYIEKTRNLKRDIQLDTKVVVKYEILRREHSYLTKTFKIYLKSEVSAFTSIKIDENQYNRMAIGQYAILTHSRYSKVLFEIIYQ